ncbi:MAG: hypothetical protein ACXVIF_05895 [Halobacteriota archaeon]
MLELEGEFLEVGSAIKVLVNTLNDNATPAQIIGSSVRIDASDKVWLKVDAKL